MREALSSSRGKEPTTASDFKDVTISTNGILKPDASAAITVEGNWSNSGTFTHNSGTVTFDGTTAVTAGDANATPSSLGAVTLNKTSATTSNNKVTLNRLYDEIKILKTLKI